MGFKRPEVRILSPRHRKPTELQALWVFPFSGKTAFTRVFVHNSVELKVQNKVQNWPRASPETLQGTYSALAPRLLWLAKARKERPLNEPLAACCQRIRRNVCPECA